MRDLSLSPMGNKVSAETKLRLMPSTRYGIGDLAVKYVNEVN